MWWRRFLLPANSRQRRRVLDVGCQDHRSGCPGATVGNSRPLQATQDELSHSFWRQGSESNRRRRLCKPLHLLQIIKIRGFHTRIAALLRVHYFQLTHLVV